MKTIQYPLFTLFFLISALAGQSQSVQYKWAQAIGSTGGVSQKAACSDPSGNLISIGNFTGTMDINPGPGTSVIYSGASPGDSATTTYIVKLDSTGLFLWGKKLVASGGLGRQNIQTDSLGNIYISGTFNGTLDLDPGVGTTLITGNVASALLKYSPGGVLLWAKVLTSGSQSSCQIHKISVSASGNIAALGAYYGTIDLDPDAGVASPGTALSDDIFIARYTSSGAYVWSGRIEGPGSDDPFAITQEESGEIYITGNFQATADFDPGAGVANLTTTEIRASFVAKYDAAGNYLWANSFGQSISRGVETDTNGNVYIGGVFSGTLVFPAPLGNTSVSIPNSGNNSNIYFAKITSAGSLIWAKAIGSAYADNLLAIEVSEGGEVYLSGSYDGSMDLDPGPGTVNVAPSAGSDILLAKYTSNGEYVWSLLPEGSPQSTERGNVVLGTNRSLYLWGGFYAPIDFDASVATSLLTPPSFNSNYFARYQENGCGVAGLAVLTQTDVSCAAPGTASVAMVGTLAPSYTYQWNTTPASTTTTASFSTPGFYTVTASSSDGCTYLRTLFIDGPTYLSGKDFKVSLAATSFRPGLSSDIWLNGVNEGCTPASGILRLVLDPQISYQSATPAPNTINGDTLIWNFSDLTYDTPLTPQITTLTDLSASIGDTIRLHAAILPLESDLDTTNNFLLYTDAVINSYDPNDKQVYPRGEGAAGKILNNQTHTYTVRFQNTGNAPALLVRVLDTLDTDLDLQSLHIVGYSHPMRTELLPGNALAFIFENINLPDSSSNEPASHGYVIFEVAQQPNLPHNQEITNTAYIYFDFNPAIVTNTTLNTIDLCPITQAAAQAGPDLTICAGEGVELPSSSTGSVFCQWSPSSGAGTGAQFVYPDTTTSYILSCTDANGCQAQDQFTVFVNPMFEISIGGNMFDAIFASINVTNQQDFAFQWVNCDSGYTSIEGATEESFRPTYSGNYAVIATSPSGCSDTSYCVSYNVAIDPALDKSFSVSPNPAYDRLSITSEDAGLFFSAQIYDLNGRELFSTDKGKEAIGSMVLNINELSPGVYVLKLTDIQSGRYAVRRFVKE
ncbi:MAG: T9SS C-terminal target domain-containing protein [Bacteroidetes bacterium]|nr:MAG: T9SS C-terminal target domain-containing protein [Bacteroidota bacterium]